MLSSFSIWDWSQIIGTLLVLIGVAGELVLLIKKFRYNPTNFPPVESLKRKLEILSVVILLAGLVLEVVALPHSLLEVAKLERSNLELQVKLKQVRIDQMPRATKLSLAWLSESGGLPTMFKTNVTGEVMIWYLPNDPEAQEFARELWIELREAGWKTIGFEQPIPSDTALKETEEMRRAKEERLPLFSLVPIDGLTSIVVATSGGVDWNKMPMTPAKALIDGLVKCGFAVSGGGNKNLLAPTNAVLLVVGQKQ
jgi:hypothetical protein